MLMEHDRHAVGTNRVTARRRGNPPRINRDRVVSLATTISISGFVFEENLESESEKVEKITVSQSHMVIAPVNHEGSPDLKNKPARKLIVVIMLPISTRSMRGFRQILSGLSFFNDSSKA